MNRLLTIVFAVTLINLPTSANQGDSPQESIEEQSPEILPAGNFYIQGTRYWVSKTDKYLMVTTWRKTKSYFILQVGIQNDSKFAVTFDPSIVKVRNLMGDPDPRYFSPKEITKKIRRSTKWATFFRALASGMESFGAQQTTTTRQSGSFNAYDSYGNFVYGNYSGNKTTSTQADTSHIQKKASRDIALIREAGEKRKQQTEQRSLYIHTIMPGSYILGDIYFSKIKERKLNKSLGVNKKGFLVSVFVPLGDEVFRVSFPFYVIEEMLKRNPPANLEK